MNRDLFYKSEGVKDCVKWLEKKIKETKVNSNNNYFEPNSNINTMISIKISLEKYMKKLKHEANEE